MILQGGVRCLLHLRVGNAGTPPEPLSYLVKVAELSAARMELLPQTVLQRLQWHPHCQWASEGCGHLAPAALQLPQGMAGSMQVCMRGAIVTNSTSGWACPHPPTPTCNFSSLRLPLRTSLVSAAHRASVSPNRAASPLTATAPPYRGDIRQGSCH
jgi:hypothetical protein